MKTTNRKHAEISAIIATLSPGMRDVLVDALDTTRTHGSSKGPVSYRANEIEAHSCTRGALSDRCLTLELVSGASILSSIGVEVAQALRARRVA